MKINNEVEQHDAHGYLLVDIVEKNFNYSGVDRNPWGLIDELYYENKLPQEILALYQKICTKQYHGLWWPICLTMDEVISCKNFVLGNGGDVEIVGVFSQYLASENVVAKPLPKEFVNIGYDIISVGEWSLLSEILKMKNKDSIDNSYINEYGLLKEKNIRYVEEKYRILTLEKEIEPIAERNGEFNLDIVTIFKPLII